jgi:WD40 repeat protein
MSLFEPAAFGSETIDIKWNTDGSRLAFACSDLAEDDSYEETFVNQRIHIIDPTTRTILLTLPQQANAIAWKYGGSELVSGGDDSFIRRWDAQTGHLIAEYRHTTASLFPNQNIPVPVYGIEYSPDGKTIASGGLDNLIRFWDVATGSITNTIDLGMTTSFDLKKAVNWLGWDATGKRFACANWDGTLRIWDSITEPPVLSLVSKPGSLGHAAWSPDSQSIASGQEDGTIYIWDALSGESRHIINDHTKHVCGICWSSDGKRLASASTDSTVKIWDAKTGENVSTIQVTNEVYAVDWTSDGRLAFAPLDDYKSKHFDSLANDEFVPPMPIILKIDDQLPSLVISGYL